MAILERCRLCGVNKYKALEGMHKEMIFVLHPQRYLHMLVPLMCPYLCLLFENSDHYLNRLCVDELYLNGIIIYHSCITNFTILWLTD